MPQKRKFFSNIFLCLASLTFSLIVSEAILRWRENQEAKKDIQLLQRSNVGELFSRKFSDEILVRFFNGCFMDRGVIEIDPELGYKNIPGVDGYSVHIDGASNAIIRKPADLSVIPRKHLKAKVTQFRVNNLGNRGPQMPAGKPPGTSRIVFIGDSITFGYYVEEEEAFAQLVGKGLPSLLTTGCTFEVLNAGVSGLNSRQAFNHLTQRALYWSPDLVVWSFYLNDVLDSPGAEADILFPVRRLGLLSFLRFSALGRRLGNFIFSTRWGASLGIDPEEQANQLVEAGWRNAAEDLQRASAILAAKNIPLLVVVFPSAIQFGRSWTRPQYQARLKALCAKYKIGCIDLLPIFGQAGPASALYYYGDLIHPNAKGHFLAAEAILSFLKAHPAYLETLTKNCR